MITTGNFTQQKFLYASHLTISLNPENKWIDVKLVNFLQNAHSSSWFVNKHFYEKPCFKICHTFITINLEKGGRVNHQYEWKLQQLDYATCVSDDEHSHQYHEQNSHSRKDLPVKPNSRLLSLDK